MQLTLTAIQLIILFSTSSLTIASDYALPLRLVSRQSSFFCPVVTLLFPSTFTSCGNGYITPDCTCCSGGLIGCLMLTQTCAIDATGRSICCDNTSSDCLPIPGGGGGCATEGKVYCGGNGCLPGGYGCCPNDPTHGGCPLEQYCCLHPDGTPSCCVVNSDISSPSNTATGQSSDSLTSPTSGAAPTSAESFNFGTGSSTTAPAISTSNSGTSTTISDPFTSISSSSSGSSTTTSAISASNDGTSTAISGPSTSISSSSSTRVYVVGAARGSHSFIFQPAMPFIAIYYFLLVGIFA